MDYSEFRQDEINGWSQRAGGYGKATALATVQTIPTLLAAVRLYPGARMLDAGCGPGYAAGAAMALGASCVGVDNAPAMIDAAHTRYPGSEFKTGDIEALDFPDHSFDIVAANIVLFHVTDPRKSIAEAFRVLRPGGRFAFSQWCGPDRSECYKLIYDVISAHADMTLASPAPNAFDLSQPDHAKSVLEDAGFTDTATVHVPNVLRTGAESFYDFFMQFGVRIPLIMQRQSNQVQATVRAEIDERAQAFRVGDEFHMPMPSIVVSGQRPA
ncbi:Methyltransferase domain-containing protein [Pseudosulfitobacter pseudonitzschiae]|uniref:Methyltransferase type 11 domain-containing protein n=1 Tax=Pseudosulfitobacter pseudonitzschiae TaxID=1402135 RepID=A0A073J4R0_9RHOB|nr:methyltransferase domain-containing protein [Pseudosulfitobacter pseudonitzschiae]KEJ96959.1 hypothetical protein SUH3_09285 [Pseudosulfitobacter pseudonitzschiae]QKS07121.1 methyltransferase domain-containing protein [Pseudosulfitobacter pseudonitzschiae]SHF47726.1 Methyltransferase domain-containing protein [Pseudosulfitobacter pseudonitzschiae]